MDEETKEKILEVIRHARDDFRNDKQEERLDDNLSHYYLGVFDSLFGIYFDDIQPNFSHRQENENMSDYIERIIYEFFDMINK